MMKRIPEFWFEFKGVRNTTMGVLMQGMPVRPHPAERGEYVQVARRSGYLWVPDDSFDNVIVRLPLVTGVTFDVDAINAWLTGEDDLRFSDEPTRVYRARITKEFSRANKLSRFTAQEFTPSFDCFPFRYKYLSNPNDDDKSFATSAHPTGYTINHPGTVLSEPRLRIEGSGNFTIWVNEEQLDFTGISGGVVVDSEAQECTNLAGTALLNLKADIDEYPLLYPGDNLITWSGAVTNIAVKPRYRWI